LPPGEGLPRSPRRGQRGAAARALARHRPRPRPPAPRSDPQDLRRRARRRPDRPADAPRALPLAGGAPQHHDSRLARPRPPLRGSGAGARRAVPADGAAAARTDPLTLLRQIHLGCGVGPHHPGPLLPSPPPPPPPALSPPPPPPPPPGGKGGPLR